MRIRKENAYSSNAISLKSNAVYKNFCAHTKSSEIKKKAHSVAKTIDQIFSKQKVKFFLKYLFKKNLLLRPTKRAQTRFLLATCLFSIDYITELANY